MCTASGSYRNRSGKAKPSFRFPPTKGTPNAGCEWILRLLKNDAVIAGSTNDGLNAIGQSSQAESPVGITAFSRLRDKEKNSKLAFNMVYDLLTITGSVLI